MPSIWIRTLSRLRSSTQQFVHEPALRAELFSAEQMASHGHKLAGQHELSPRSAAGALLTRLDDNEALLARSCAMLSAVPLATRRAA